MSEESWKKSMHQGDFIQVEPVVGIPATFGSEVSVIYDDHAIYIGAILYDKDPKKILKELSIRDNLANADNFSVFFDPYNSGLNGFLFQITASGVQLDAIVSNNDEDYNWNAVWSSEISINENNWTVELKIPFSSLRFTSNEQQQWGVQFNREIRRFREQSYWNPVNPAVQGWVQQSGLLTHLENIKTPVRLGLFPYVSGYLDHTNDPKSNTSVTNTAYNAGLDVKYGINDAFTLDMTLIPDFGQVISDRQVLNLTPFEVFFEENRQFFTEGTELFNKGNLFYSRRIGSTPLHYNKVGNELLPGEKIISNPDVSQLYNATKITGRTESGTGLGIFNAIVGKTNAVLENESGLRREVQTNPLTNYNAIVIDQNLKNNSFISFMNTNVLRSGKDYDANASGLYFELKDKKQLYSVAGDVNVTQKNSADKNDAGFAYNLSGGKISGKWLYEAGTGTESVYYDPNDMGFLFNANKQYYFTTVEYQEFAPKNDKLQRWTYSFWSSYNTLYQPKHFTSFSLGFENFYLWKSRNAVGGNIYINPVESRDYFEPRTFDFERFVVAPESVTIGGFFSSDYRKPVALDINIRTVQYNIQNRQDWVITFAPRFRINDKFSVFPVIRLTKNDEQPGYVNKSLVSDIPLELSSNDVLIGIRNRFIVENTFTIRWIFNHNIGINTRIRHYYDNVRHDRFGKLTTSGEPNIIAFDGKNSKGDYIFDRNINIFNIDMQMNWRFLPGSDMIFVWKNEIFSSGNREEINYFRNLSGLTDQVQNNNFSIRVLFFVDYLYVNALKQKKLNS